MFYQLPFESNIIMILLVSNVSVFHLESVLGKYECLKLLEYDMSPVTILNSMHNLDVFPRSAIVRLQFDRRKL